MEYLIKRKLNIKLLIMKLKILIFFVLFYLMSSCYSLNDIVTRQKRYQSANHTLNQILDQAERLLGKKPNDVVYVNGKKFILDCIGTISAIYYAAGIDITQYFYKFRGNGVSRFYYTLKEADSLYNRYKPEVGDVIFWDNTWDRNGDTKFGNDPLTHVAMVVDVEEDGTVHYIHENYVLGIVVEKMNLTKPQIHKDENGKELNSPIYIGSSFYRHPEHAWLSGDLFRHFGGVIRVKDIFIN
jgi:hypothetical protein